MSSHSNYEIAETFFNSIFCTVHTHEHIHDRHIFVMPSRPLDSKPLPEYSIYVRYDASAGLVAMLDRILDDYQFALPWEDRERDIANIVRALEDDLLVRAGGDG
ncbi:MAG: isocitrate dehydrogenase kinase/phosphatase AceK regulatory subunit, partial [bacterium]